MRAIFNTNEHDHYLLDVESNIVLPAGITIEIGRKFYIVKNVLVSFSEHAIYYIVEKEKE